VINYFPADLCTTVGSTYIYSSALRPETRGTQIPGEAPNICGSSVWNLLHVAFLVSTTLRWSRKQARQEHVSTKSLGKKPTIKPLGAARTNPALSRKRSEDKPPNVYNAIPAENNPPTTTNSVIVSFIFMYFVLLCVSVDHLCGLVVRVSGYRYRGPGFDPRRYQIF